MLPESFLSGQKRPLAFRAGKCKSSLSPFCARLGVLAVPWALFTCLQSRCVCPARAEAAGARREEIKESRASSVARDGERAALTRVRMGLLLTERTFLLL